MEITVWIIVHRKKPVLFWTGDRWRSPLCEAKLYNSMIDTNTTINIMIDPLKEENASIHCITVKIGRVD